MTLYCPLLENYGNIKVILWRLWQTWHTPGIVQCTAPTTVRGQPCIILHDFNSTWPCKNTIVKATRRSRTAGCCFKALRLLGSANTNPTPCFSDFRISTQKVKQHSQRGLQLVADSEFIDYGSCGRCTRRCDCLFSRKWMCPNPKRRLLPVFLTNVAFLRKSWMTFVILPNVNTWQCANF